MHKTLLPQSSFREPSCFSAPTPVVLSFYESSDAFQTNQKFTYHKLTSANCHNHEKLPETLSPGQSRPGIDGYLFFLVLSNYECRAVCLWSQGRPYFMKLHLISLVKEYPTAHLLLMAINDLTKWSDSAWWLLTFVHSSFHLFFLQVYRTDIKWLQIKNLTLR